MKDPNRIYTFKKPDTIVDLHTGSWYYNYDIQSEEVKIPEFKVKKGINTETLYSFIQIKLDTEPTYKNCVEKIIREYKSQTQEFDLINSANKDILAGLTDTDNIKKYQDYLDTVEQIKINVKKDFNQ